MSDLDITMLSPNPKAVGIFWQSLVEVTGGFAARSFSEVDRYFAENLLQRLDKDERAISQYDVQLLERALEFTLSELCLNEFQTLTGYDYEDGLCIARDLKSQRPKLA